MSEFKVLFAEGSTVNRPPMFNGMNYAFWKIKMQIFMESTDALIWEVVVHGPYAPMQVVKDEEVVKPRSEWNETERRKAKNVQNFVWRSIVLPIRRPPRNNH